MDAGTVEQQAMSLKEIDSREGGDDSYVSRRLNLTALASDSVAAILDETLPLEVTQFKRGGGRCCGISSGGGLKGIDDAS
jgi:hypothetical protein